MFDELFGLVEQVEGNAEFAKNADDIAQPLATTNLR